MGKVNNSLILSALMTYKKFTTKTQLGQFLGVSTQVLGNWFAQKNELDIHKILEACPEIDANWLLTGEGNMLKEESSINIDASAQSHNNGGTYINGGDEAGMAALQKENELLKEQLKKAENDKAFLQGLVDKLASK